MYPNDQVGVTSAFTNQHEFALYGGLKPIDDMAVNTRLSWFWHEDGQLPFPAGGDRSSYVGAEWDIRSTYDYTDDVQFGLDYGVFFPGSVFHENGEETQVNGRDTAQEIITKVSVKF